MVKIHNKSDKPDNIVAKQHHIIDKCIEIETALPHFMKDYFIYLKMQFLYLQGLPTSKI